ncbi:MAG: hypothetical protein ABIH89_05560 [Elusimicrobiota bacterium]
MLVTVLSPGISEAYNYGTAGAQILDLHTSARIIAMGDAGVGLADDLNAVVYNPAGLICLSGTDIQATHMIYYVGTNMDSLTVGRKIRNIGVAVKWKYFYTGDSIRSDDGTKTNSYDISFAQYTAGFGAPLNDKHSVGVSIKAVTEKIYTESGSTIGADIGWYFNTHGVKTGSINRGRRNALMKPDGNYRDYTRFVDLHNLQEKAERRFMGGRRMRHSFGAVIRNIGGKIETVSGKSSSLPLVFAAGAAHELNYFGGITAVWEAFTGVESAVGFKCGIETQIESFKARLGFNYTTQPDFMAGFGIPQNNWRIDYALTRHWELGLAHRITVGVDF